MLLPDGDEVEAIAPSHVPVMDFFKELLPKCCHAHSTTHGTGPSRKLSNIRYPASHDGFANSYWNVWQCGRGDTHATAQEVRLKGIVWCCSSVNVSSVLHSCGRRD